MDQILCCHHIQKFLGRMALALILTGVFTSGAWANTSVPNKTILTCIFNHPYIVIMYDPETGEVTYYDEFDSALVLTERGSLVPNLASNQNPDVYKAVPGSRYKIIRPGGEVILDLTFSYKGFDGNTELSYPFEAIFYDRRYNDQFAGGCYTENALPISFAEIISEITQL